MTTIPKGSIPLDAEGNFRLYRGEVEFWSESNFRYEIAWWLNPNVPLSPVCRALRAERPLRLDKGLLHIVDIAAVRAVGVLHEVV